ncbi:hypothetical protein [Nocardia aurea]|uniref:hypothetical protein n=1 Tax=Nocardia aurea TaxID=2144174 RepID=UPI0033B25210
MPAPTLGTSTRYRLARITALVLGSLVFLYACERSRSSMLSDVLGEVLLAACLGIAGIAAAWFEISLSNRTAEQEAAETGESGEFLLESEGRRIRARIAPSGNLVFHGREISDGPQAHEWSWTFRPNTFPAIRTALGGGDGELVRLLEEIVPRLDRHSRRDPGAWVRAHGITATYREKGDNPSHATRKLPILKRGLPRELQTGRVAAIAVGTTAAPAAPVRRDATRPPSGPNPRVTPEPSRVSVRGGRRADRDVDDSDLDDIADSAPAQNYPPSLRDRLDQARGLLARVIPQRRADDEFDDVGDFDDLDDLDDEYDDEYRDDPDDELFAAAARSDYRPAPADYDDYSDYDVRYDDAGPRRRPVGDDATARRSGATRRNGSAATDRADTGGRRAVPARAAADRVAPATRDRHAPEPDRGGRADRIATPPAARFRPDDSDADRDGRPVRDRAAAQDRPATPRSDWPVRPATDSTPTRSRRGLHDSGPQATVDPTASRSRRPAHDSGRQQAIDPTSSRRNASHDAEQRSIADPAASRSRRAAHNSGPQSAIDPTAPRSRGHDSGQPFTGDPGGRSRRSLSDPGPEPAGPSPRARSASARANGAAPAEPVGDGRRGRRDQDDYPVDRPARRPVVAAEPRDRRAPAEDPAARRGAAAREGGARRDQDARRQTPASNARRAANSRSAQQEPIRNGRAVPETPGRERSERTRAQPARTPLEPARPADARRRAPVTSERRVDGAAAARSRRDFDDDYYDDVPRSRHGR